MKRILTRAQVLRRTKRLVERNDGKLRVFDDPCILREADGAWVAGWVKVAYPDVVGEEGMGDA